MNKQFAPVPMPKIGTIIKPLHNREIIAWWEKKERPRGKFVRIIWDGTNNLHTAVCRQNFTTGIVAFIVGRPPSFGDDLKVVSVGKNTCRVVAWPKYHDAAKTVIENYKESTGDEDHQKDPSIVWESIDVLCSDMLEDQDLMGFDVTEANEQELLAAQAVLTWNVLTIMEHGDPPEHREYDKDGQEKIIGENNKGNS